MIFIYCFWLEFFVCFNNASVKHGGGWGGGEWLTYSTSSLMVGWQMARLKKENGMPTGQLGGGCIQREYAEGTLAQIWHPTFWDGVCMAQLRQHQASGCPCFYPLTLILPKASQAHDASGFIYVVRWGPQQLLKGDPSPDWCGTVSWALDIVLCTEKSPVQFLVRTHAQVANLIPGRGACGRQSINFSLSSLSLSLAPFLHLFLSLPLFKN